MASQSTSTSVGVGSSNEPTIVEVLETTRNKDIWQHYDLCKMSDVSKKGRCKQCDMARRRKRLGAKESRLGESRLGESRPAESRPAEGRPMVGHQRVGQRRDNMLRLRQEREGNQASAESQVDETTLYIEAASGAKKRNLYGAGSKRVYYIKDKDSGNETTRITKIVIQIVKILMEEVIIKDPTLVTPEQSSLDSSSERSLDSSSPSAGPSRKRRRSPTTLRGHMKIGSADAKAVEGLGISDGVGAPTKDGIGMRVEAAASDIREDEEKFEAEASAGGTMEIAVDPLVTGGISESTGGDLEAVQLMASEERADLTDRIRSLRRENLRVKALQCIERDRVDSLRCHMALSWEEFRQIRRDHDDTRRRLRRL
uniref:Zinc finger, BED-type, phospholipase-like, homeodomain-like protein n=1 Tax=Tanacetum cinerariifolium TaxID=118510 RepID=A0A6L2LE17_TANCI|nr:zinc finger, BED-type, phospholipase-like, homeodomain-like protein [Tanacetum cinerariifolium]